MGFDRMTAKRFILRLSTLGNGMITDTERNKDLFFDKEFLDATLPKTNDWLNELSEENEQLKKQLDDCREYIEKQYANYTKNNSQFAKEIREWEKSYDELKKELENCRECLELNRESCARHMKENVVLKQDVEEWKKSSTYWSKQHTELEKENEHLKSQNRLLKGKLHRLRMEKGAMEEEIECLSEETIEKFKQDLQDGNFIEFTAR